MLIVASSEIEDPEAQPILFECLDRNPGISAVATGGHGELIRRPAAYRG
jgi:hypothetical protein